jgi:hypothetical protein
MNHKLFPKIHHCVLYWVGRKLGTSRRAGSRMQCSNALLCLCLCSAVHMLQRRAPFSLHGPMPHPIMQCTKIRRLFLNPLKSEPKLEWWPRPLPYLSLWGLGGLRANDVGVSCDFPDGNRIFLKGLHKSQLRLPQWPREQWSEADSSSPHFFRIQLYANIMVTWTATPILT